MPASKSPSARALPVELQRLVEVGVGDRPAVGPAQQGGEDLLGAGFLVGRRLSARQTKMRRRLGVSPGPFASKGPVIETW